MNLRPFIMRETSDAPDNNTMNQSGEAYVVGLGRDYNLLRGCDLQSLRLSVNDVHRPLGYLTRYPPQLLMNEQ